MLQPELTVPEYEAQHGGPLYKTNPNQCCFDRKVKVLRGAAEGQHAWMSGIRRDQSTDRARAAIVEWDKKFNLVKISPLANWTKKDVWKRILDEERPLQPAARPGLPEHRLLALHPGRADGEPTNAPAAGAAPPRPSAACTRSNRKTAAASERCHVIRQDNEQRMRM